MTDRFTEDSAASYTRVGLPAATRRQVRRAAEERAYQRWEQELRRKYRDVQVAHPSGFGDELFLETLANADDRARLIELVNEELGNSGVIA